MIKFEKILSCSSEHTFYPSSNLLNGKEGWTSAKSGLDQISVVIKLNKEAFINFIEIGNHFSAFVEVWVSKNENNDDSQFEVLLSPSSFMTPNESKNESNINRVRCFEQDKLSSSALKKKWDLIKVICSQPFNKTVNYGIKFIRLKESESPLLTSDSPKPSSSINLGSFSLKAIDSDKSNDISVGSYFLKHQNKSEIDTELLLSTDDKKTTSSFLKRRQRSPTPKAYTQNNVDKEQKNSSQIPSTSSPKHQRRSSTDRKKKKHSPTSTPQSSSENEPFNKILSHVVFAISGFQNPKRSEIRNKGLEMGAKYKPDWEASCTHLICAFPNTPKYNHVKNLNGIIVTKEWIEECYKEKRLMPFKYYQLKSSKKRHSDSEDSEDTSDNQKAKEEEDEDEEQVQKTKKQARKRKRTMVYFETDEENEDDDDNKEKSSKTSENVN